MDSAKAAVKDFISRAGKHDTTVHEKVAPSVTHENIQKQQREEVTTAVDKEIHQDHHHTTIQPIKDQEVLPEQHHHRVAGVEHREFDHGNDANVKQKLQGEAAKYRDETTRSEGVTTSHTAPTVRGEHVHHHVHETIQPVIQKQTIDPHVVHTTVPVHETHRNAAQFHETSTLPAVSMGEFKNDKSFLSGRGERTDGFAGEPKTVGKTFEASDRNVPGAIRGDGVGAQTHSTGLGSHTQQTGLGGQSGLTGGHSGNAATQGSTVGSVDDQMRNTNLGNDTGSKNKASMMDKLNPRVDSDGDGKKGIMD